MPMVGSEKQLENIENRVNAMPAALKDAMLKFKRSLATYSPSTSKMYMQRLIAFITFTQNKNNNNDVDIFHDGKLDRIKDDIMDFKFFTDSRIFTHTDRPPKHASSRMTLHALEKFYKSAYNIRIVPPGEKFAEYFGILHQYRGEIDLINDKEFERLVEFSPNNLWKAMIYTMGTSGVRVGELCNLRMRDLFFEENKIRVEFGKYGVEGDTLFSPKAQEYVRSYLGERDNLKSSDDFVFWRDIEKRRRISRDSVYFGLLKIAKVSQIQRSVYPHLLRHYCFTKWASLGVSLKIIQKCARHKDMSTTGMYIDLAQHEQADFFQHPPKE